MRALALWRGITVLLLLLLVVPPLYAQEPTPDPTLPDPVLDIMSRMSPEMKVGQLVFVSFPGTDCGDDTAIANLIREYGVGGILLRPQNDNFDSAGVEPTQLVSMTNRLQEIAWESSRMLRMPVLGEAEMTSELPYIPLFVAVETGVNGVPVTAFISGTASLPTPMALGASWDRSLAEATGNVLGQELAALGINLFLGPDLDVLYTPRPGDPSDLGTSVFGSDPFWVGELGKAYVRGLHQGSNGKMLVVPRHLPGLGGADRPLEEEVPTVQKSLEQLKQIELAPFFAVSKDVPGADAAADAFLVTHIRYRGFQGNIRQTTRPISLDAQALQLVTGLAEVAPWRQAGGVLISDNLGMKSVHRSYDPRGLSFNARRVVQDALVAGNDLLVLDRFAADNSDWDLHFANIRDTLKFLASRYKDDPTFQVTVDNALYRLLSMKMRVYSGFPSNAVQVDPEVLGTTFTTALSEGQSVSAQVASSALTRVFPLSDDLLLASPQGGESIVIFTQEYDVRTKADAAPRLLLSANAVKEALLRFYGPDGTGVVRFNSVQSFTFEQLQAALEESGQQPEGETSETAPGGTAPSPISSAILRALQQARWIIFATTGLKSADPTTWAVKTFLSKQASLLDAHIVVFSFGPPYELDSTEISKLDLYYALYAPGPAFVDVAVRVLFRDALAPGASPATMPALNYLISLQTMPDPEQVISLNIVDSTGQELTPDDRANIRKNDVVNFRTGIIVDQNGHPIPDGTPVQFILSYPQEGIERTVVAEAYGGVGATSVTLDRVGQLDITVQSEPALSSVRLQLTIRENEVIFVTIEPPAPTPTPTPTPMPEQTPTPEPEPPKAQHLPGPIRLPEPRRELLLGWGFGGVSLVLVLGFIFARERALDVIAATRVAFWGAIGALGGYVMLMAIGRLRGPAWRYSMVGREYAAGGIALALGCTVLLIIAIVDLVNRRLRKSRED